MIMKYFSSKYNIPEESFRKIIQHPIFQDGSDKGEAGVSGADVENLCREEAMRLLREHIIMNCT